MVERVAFGNVLAGLANDDDEFTLIVQLVLLADLGYGDVFVVGGNRSGRLDEYRRIWRWLATAFLNCAKRSES